MRGSLLIALKGAMMGMAEVVPGVSGGTIAFVTGIYEQLLRSIRTVMGTTSWQLLRREGVKPFWQYINGPFLVTLILGMAVGLVVGVLGISWLLLHYPRLLWAFFFGLIIASVWYVGRQVTTWSGREVTGLIVGTVVAFLITLASPSAGNTDLWFVFLSGMIAISALLLPGLSGSFMLLLLGMYSTVLGWVRAVLTMSSVEVLLPLGVFAFGCLVGLTSFSRLLTWTFSRYRNETLAVLCGFMLGSLNKLWPWRIVTRTRVNSHGEEVAMLEKSVLPTHVEDPQILGVLICALMGVALVLGISKLDKRPILK